MAKFMFSSLSIEEYLTLHPKTKLTMIEEIIFLICGYKDQYLSTCARIVFYNLERQPIKLETLQRKRYIQNEKYFELNASLNAQKRRLEKLRVEHLRIQKQIANEKKRTEQKKGVYVLLDSDHKKRLDQIVKAEKTTITALLIELIDSKLPEHS
jgi:hypothetical protein